MSVSELNILILLSRLARFWDDTRNYNSNDIVQY